MKKNQYGLQGSISYIKSRKVYRVFAPVNNNNLDSKGHKIRKSLGSFKTLEEAQKQLSLYTKTPITYTLKDITELWLNDRLAITTKINTKTTLQFAYNSIIKLFAPILNENIQDIHNKDITKILYNTCYSYSSLTLIKTYLNDIFNYALSNSWIENNYISLIKLPKITNTEKICNTYTEEDIKILFNALTDEKYSDKMKRYIKIMLVLLYSGLRKEELFKASFDLHSNIISVKESKSYNGIRLVPIHHKIQNFISDYNPDTLKPVILDNITEKQLNYNFNVINEKLGLGIHTVHNCRKSFITRLISKGGNLPLIAKLVGHSTKSITVDIYTKPDIDSLRSVINLLD